MYIDPPTNGAANGSDAVRCVEIRTVDNASVVVPNAELTIAANGSAGPYDYNLPTSSGSVQLGSYTVDINGKAWVWLKVDSVVTMVYADSDESTGHTTFTVGTHGLENTAMSSINYVTVVLGVAKTTLTKSPSDEKVYYGGVQINA